jgi:hypothetical protein
MLLLVVDTAAVAVAVCLFVCCMGLLLNPSPFFSPPFSPSHSDSLLLLLLLS